MRRNTHGKPEVLLSVDIETSGPSVRSHGILALGLAVYHPNGQVHSFCFPAQLEDGKKYDEITKANFWDQHADLLHDLQSKAEPLSIALKKFVNVLDFYDERYYVTIVLDHPVFDCAFINEAMDRLFGRKGLSYALDKRFRMPIDMRSFGIGVLQGEEEFRKFRKRILNEQQLVVTHSPDMDCVLNLQVYVATLALLKPSDSKGARQEREEREEREAQEEREERESRETREAREGQGGRDDEVYWGCGSEGGGGSGGGLAGVGGLAGLAGWAAVVTGKEAAGCATPTSPPSQGVALRTRC